MRPRNSSREAIKVRAGTRILTLEIEVKLANSLIISE